MRAAELGTVLDARRGGASYSDQGPNRRAAGGGPVMQPLVGVIMGSKSDWETLRHAAQTLDALGVTYERRVVSAHRTPDLLFDYVSSAAGRGLEVIIAGAGGAAHLP